MGLTFSEAKALGIESYWPSQVSRELKGAMSCGMMNKIEARFAEMLERMKGAGSIRDWAFEAEKFRLADRTWWTPDFRLTLPDSRSIFVEVKVRDREGKLRWTDDGAVKAKTIPELHPHVFYLASYGIGGWIINRLPSRNFGWIDVDLEWLC